MGGLDHGPNEPEPVEDPTSAAERSRIGLSLFAVYLLIYGGFVMLNTFAPDRMEATPLFGVNLAILYGVFLILAALALALLYGWLCRNR